VGRGCKRTLALFFEGQLSLLVVVLVLASASVFATLEVGSISCFVFNREIHPER
jgi:hypothetical protein